MGTATELHLKIEKIQTWLFAIPRLRAMVGANVLLAKVLQEELPALVRRADAPWKIAAPSKDKKYPGADPLDPLGAFDDPRADAEHGITSRHGGHFVVQLERGDDALAAEITELLQRRLPGLRFSFRHGNKPPKAAQLPTFTSPELPVLAPCKWSGAGLASAKARTGDDEEHASLEAVRRQAAAREAERGQAISYTNALSAMVHGELATEFRELAADRYLAIIHADGNGVGEEAKEHKGPRALATFHHQNRVAMKRALAAALRECRDEEAMRRGDPVAPLLPLMLGGDDLLVACRGNVALDFVISLCRHLDAQQRERDAKPRQGKAPFRLTLGVGVVFAPYTLPFNRLHDAAEALAASAKRHPEKGQRSVVDWAVCTSAWVDKDVVAARQEWVRGPRDAPRVLSRRPMPVLTDPRALGQPSLERLTAAAASLREEPQVARSQLRDLVDQLGRGEALAALAWQELAPPTRAALEGLNFALWDEAPGAKSTASGARPAPSKPPSQVPSTLTSLLDLVEVFEIPTLGGSR